MRKLINETLTNIRKKHKLSRNGLEEISGFKSRTIESYERGQNPPSKEYVEFICLYFGYSKEYIEGKRETILNELVIVINMYQSIYNYDNKKMAGLLEISEDNYENDFFYLSQKTKLNKNDSYNNFLILEKLKIKPSCIELSIEELKYKAVFNDNKIENLKERFDKLSLEGLNINREYYASIIRQRNQPKNITPNTQKGIIPDKYKEILELLPYAPDSFIQNLKKKLINLKEVQEIEDL